MSYLMKSKAVLICAISGGLSLAAATSYIGVAMSQGNIFINDARTAGNATLRDGSTLETQTSGSQVKLNGGAQLRLASESRGTIYADHIELQKGSARISGYSANASGLRVMTDAKSSANVSMRDGVVQVAALTGNVHVFNSAGMNVANLLPGRALDLTPQEAGASAPSTLTGCAVKSGNSTLLTDETSNVTFQLQGGNVRAGRRVQITGSTVPNSTPAGGATQVLNVTGVKEVGGSCSNPAGAAAAGGAAAGAAGAASGAAAGISASTAVIAGVAAAAAAGIGGAAAAGVFGGSNPQGGPPCASPPCNNGTPF